MGDPIEIHVVYRNDDYVKDLERQLAEAKAQRDRAEYQFRCECIVNTELLDLCKQHGVKYRPSLLARPWGEGGR